MIPRKARDDDVHDDVFLLRYDTAQGLPMGPAGKEVPFVEL